jgi:hypothetical protein
LLGVAEHRLGLWRLVWSADVDRPADSYPDDGTDRLFRI